MRNPQRAENQQGGTVTHLAAPAMSLFVFCASASSSCAAGAGDR
jgi:hypothetical protein